MKKLIFLFVFFSMFNFQKKIFSMDIENQKLLSDVAIIILFETDFQDSLRQNSLNRSLKTLENINEKIKIISGYKSFPDDLKSKLNRITAQIKKDLLNNNFENQAEYNFNKLIKTLYECYNNFEIKDSPEINYFIVDLIQFQSYIQKKKWNYMLIETEEMLDFYGAVIDRFDKKKLLNPFNKFLLKYFKISIVNLKNAVLDKDIETVKSLVSELTKLLKNFQYIYENR
ncbi:MAG TPA: hypothetical protein PKY81_12805 [bacterium]|nr:hypothetical protein [bacterium]HPN31827.1 hypothetical protein [bacterium]